MQPPGTSRELEATPIRNVFVAGSGEFVANSADTDLIARTPIQYEGDEVIFSPDHMEVDFPYGFTFLGHSMLAVKRQDGTIDFYYLP